jgi:hypothetical protein
MSDDTEIRNLRAENAKLRAEVDVLRSANADLWKRMNSVIEDAERYRKLRMAKCRYAVVDSYELPEDVSWFVEDELDTIIDSYEGHSK